MGSKSAIGWTDNTFNAWRGCLKVSAACQFCYADSFSKRNPKSLGVFGTEAAGGTRVVAADKYWRQPIKWDDEARSDRKLYEFVYDQPLTTEQITTLSQLKRAGERVLAMADRGQVEHRWKLWHPIEYHAPRVFSASLSDVFEDWNGPMLDHKGECLYRCHCRSYRYLDGSCGACGKLPHGGRLTMDDVRLRLFRLIDKTPNLTWQLLTKRPENIRRMWNTWPEGSLPDGESGRGSGTRYLPNVWIGTTVENREAADLRVPQLLACSDLAAQTFLSMEPLLGPVTLPLCFHSSSDPNQHDHSQCAPIPRWVIVGCESGSKRRETKLDWVRDLRDQCEGAGVPFFVKQLEIGGVVTADVSKFPEDLQIQQFPKPRHPLAAGAEPNR